MTISFNLSFQSLTDDNSTIFNHSKKKILKSPSMVYSVHQEVPQNRSMVYNLKNIFSLHGLNHNIPKSPSMVFTMKSIFSLYGENHKNAKIVLIVTYKNLNKYNIFASVLMFKRLWSLHINSKLCCVFILVLGRCCNQESWKSTKV